MITHGHKIIDADVDTIIIGHEHPAIGIVSNNRREVFKSYIVSRYKDKELIVLPSMFPLIPGSDLLREKTLSPYINNIDEAIAFLMDDHYNIYPGVKIKKLRL